VQTDPETKGYTSGLGVKKLSDQLVIAGEAGYPFILRIQCGWYRGSVFVPQPCVGGLPRFKRGSRYRSRHI